MVVCGRQPRRPRRRTTFEACDVRDPEQVDGARRAHRGRAHGRLDIAVNNAGGSPTAAAADARPRASPRRSSGSTSSRPLHVAQAANRVMQAQDTRRVDRQHRQRQRRCVPRPARPPTAPPRPGCSTSPRPSPSSGRRRCGSTRCPPGSWPRDDSLDHYGGRRGPGPGGRPRCRAVASATRGDVADAVVFLASPLGRLRHRRQPGAPRRGRVARLPPRRRGLRPSGRDRRPGRSRGAVRTRDGRRISRRRWRRRTARRSHRRLPSSAWRRRWRRSGSRGPRRRWPGSCRSAWP